MICAPRKTWELKEELKIMEGEKWGWCRKDKDEDRIHGEMQYLEGGWAYTGFCCAVHPAGVSLKFIKSSNVKRVGGGGKCPHTPYDMYEATGSQKKTQKNGQRKVAVLERANRSWLVRERSWQPTCLCLCLSASECVCSECHRFRLHGGRGERERVAVNAVSAASGLVDQQWQSNPTGRRRVWGHTHTQVWHAVRIQSIAQFACLCLIVYTQVCVCVCVYICEHIVARLSCLHL